MYFSINKRIIPLKFIVLMLQNKVSDTSKILHENNTKFRKFSGGPSPHTAGGCAPSALAATASSNDTILPRFQIPGYGPDVTFEAIW